MTIYAVHAPVAARENIAAAADRCAFVRDSFSWGAFVFGPLWLLRHQLWLAFLGWLGAALLFWAGSYWLNLSGGAIFWGLVAINAFLGLEGSMLRSAALRRRGYELADIVATDSRDDAERIFYPRWLAGFDKRREQREPTFRPVTPAASPQGERIIGTIPDAEA
jgi:Protein of unknown function (DUF2628)